MYLDTLIRVRELIVPNGSPGMRVRKKQKPKECAEYAE